MRPVQKQTKIYMDLSVNRYHKSKEATKIEEASGYSATICGFCCYHISSTNTDWESMIMNLISTAGGTVSATQM